MIDDSEYFNDDDTERLVDSIERRKPYEPYIEAALGLREHWYAALFGPELGEGKIRGEMICGERILFKRVEGTVYGIADRCPHRGAAFSARPECFSTNTVTCWSHGFTFDVRDGSLVQILTEPGSKLIGKLTHKTYPVRELNGVVFVYIGDANPPPPLEQDVQPLFAQPLVCHPVARNKSRANWRLAAENGYDAAHLYAHRNAGMFQVADVPVPLSTFPSRKESVTVLDGDEGPWGILKYDDVNVWTADVEGKAVSAANVSPEAPPEGNWDIVVGLFMPCGLQVDYFPLPGVLQFEWYTPIDEDHHMYMIAHAARYTNEADAAAFHERCERELSPMVWRQAAGQTDPVGDGPTWGFNNYDHWGREQMHHVYQYEDFWHRERLFRPDYLVVRWRMLVAKRMRGLQRRTGDWARTRGWSPDERNYDPKLGPA